MAVEGFELVGRPFAVWPATLQVMPEGILDTAFRRFFVGVRVANTSGQGWPVTELRISARGVKALEKAGISVASDWSGPDGAAIGQTASGEWVSMPALAAGAVRDAFWKLDVANATTGLHSLELELRDPAVPQTVLKATGQLIVARTTCNRTKRTFTSVCDQGVLTTSIAAVTLDQESFRRALGKARLLAAQAMSERTDAETERLRGRLADALCGAETDVCTVLAEIDATCAKPRPSPPILVVTPSGSEGVQILSDQTTNVRDNVKVYGNLFSNNLVVIGNDGLVTGNVTAKGDIQIGDRTRIEGDVTAGGVITQSPNGGAIVLGDRLENATVAAQTIPTKSISTGFQDVAVNSGSGTATNPFVIAPGKYDSIIINSNNVVALTPGLYQVREFIVNADVELRLNQGVTGVDLRVKSNLSLGDRLKVDLGTPNAGVVAQFYSSQTTEVFVGTDIKPLPVSITAPLGTIHVYSRTVVLAALSAKTVTLEPEVIVGQQPTSNGGTEHWLGTGASGLALLGYPTQIDYSVTYSGRYFGPTGPRAFDAVSWKGLVACAVLRFDLVLSAPVAEDLVSIADRAVVGTVSRAVLNAPTTAPGTAPPSSQAGSVDAALAEIRGNRSLDAPFFRQLDAVPDEANGVPVSSLAGSFSATGIVTNSEIDALLAAGVAANLRVHKSGAGTGVTRGIISAVVPVLARHDESTTYHFVNQLLIVPDPSAPSAEGKLASGGDSGSLWVQTSTNKIVGMTHAVGASGAVATRIQDVANALQIQLS